MNTDAYWITMLAVLIVGSGCATTSAPDDWQLSANAMQQETYGAWIDVSYADSTQSEMVQGELIAATDDSLFVLPLQGTLRAVARPTVKELQLTTYDANWGYLGAWTTLGALSTISHGILLMASAPVWIIGGAAATSRQSYQPIHTNPPLDTLRRYARFPQGLPPGLTQSQLRLKFP